MLDLANVFWLPIFVASLVGFVIGAIWYSPSLIGGLWMDTKGEAKGSEAAAYVVQWALTFLKSYVLAMFIINLNQTNAWGGFVVAFWVWFGFVASTLFGGVLWGKFSVKNYIGHVFGLWMIFESMGLVLGAWQW